MKFKITQLLIFVILLSVMMIMQVNAESCNTKEATKAANEKSSSLTLAILDLKVVDSIQISPGLRSQGGKLLSNIIAATFTEAGINVYDRSIQYKNLPSEDNDPAVNLSPEAVKRIAKALHVDRVMCGYVSRLGVFTQEVMLGAPVIETRAEVNMNLTIYDGKTGKFIVNCSPKGKQLQYGEMIPDDLLDRAVNDAIFDMILQLSKK